MNHKQVDNNIDIDEANVNRADLSIVKFEFALEQARRQTQQRISRSYEATVIRHHHAQ